MEAVKNKYGYISGGVKATLSSAFFPFITAGIFLACYYLGWDIVAIWYFGLTLTLMVIFLDDLTPVVSHCLFLSTVVSVKNSPSPISDGGSSAYYQSPAILGLIITLLIIIVAAIAYRLIKCRSRLRFNAMTVGLLIFSATLLLNGISSTEGYKPMTLFYGFALAFVFTLPYILVSANSVCTKENYIKIGWGFAAFAMLLLIELLVRYCIHWDDMLVDGKIRKGMLIFGWGISNTMGMMLVLCIPPLFLLAANHKFGYLFIIYATIIAFAVFLTGSRQAMLGTLIVYPVSAIVTLVAGKNRQLNAATLIAVALIIAIIAIACWQELFNIFSRLSDDLFTEEGYDGNGRMGLIRQAWDYFLAAPFFGQGFYIAFNNDPGYGGLAGFLPLMAHNTILELLATCGAIGLLGYLVHRVITVVCFLKEPTSERAFIALSVLSMLILSLLDNHIFYLFPTLIYSVLLAFSCDGRVEIKLPKALKGGKYGV